ncbi:hypothetical protein IF2G_06679 [Cordyceps javanica]|nr:hypothetical protein IF2G_06679 [Cordyceps javanica]
MLNSCSVPPGLAKSAIFYVYTIFAAWFTATTCPAFCPTRSLEMLRSTVLRDGVTDGSAAFGPLPFQSLGLGGLCCSGIGARRSAATWDQNLTALLRSWKRKESSGNSSTKRHAGNKIECGGVFETADAKADFLHYYHQTWSGIGRLRDGGVSNGRDYSILSPCLFAKGLSGTQRGANTGGHQETRAKGFQ